MTRKLLGVAVVLVFVAGVAQADDTKKAMATRKALETKITVDWKDIGLAEILDEVKDAVKDKGGGTLSWRYDTGVSRNRKMTYKGKDKTVSEILAALFEKEGLGYVVTSKEKDTYDGSVLIKMGSERGFPKEDKPKDKKDK